MKLFFEKELLVIGCILLSQGILWSIWWEIILSIAFMITAVALAILDTNNAAELRRITSRPVFPKK